MWHDGRHGGTNPQVNRDYVFVRETYMALVLPMSLMRRPFCLKDLLDDRHPRGCQKAWFYFTKANSTYNNSKVYLNYAVVLNYVDSRMFVNQSPLALVAVRRRFVLQLRVDGEIRYCISTVLVNRSTILGAETGRGI